MRKVIFPGSFDPFTNGHLDIVKRLSYLFDEVVIAIGQNKAKSNWFSKEERQKLIQQVMIDLKIKNVSVIFYDGLTMKLVHELGAQSIARGIRNINDYQYEKNIAEVNKKLANVETVFLMARDENQSVSSSMVKELAYLGADIMILVPSNIAKAINQKIKECE